MYIERFRGRKLHSLPHLNNDKFKGCSIPEIREIIELNVCEFFDQPIDKVRSRSRKRIYVMPRQMIMFLMVHYTDYSLLQIGAFLNKKDHTSAVHSKETIQGFLDQRTSTAEKLQVNALLYRYGYKVIEAPVEEQRKVFVIDANY